MNFTVGLNTDYNAVFHANWTIFVKTVYLNKREFL